MYKALGIVLIILSSGIYSYKTVEKKRQQLTNLKEFKKALFVIHDELCFSMSEISVLCKTVSKRTKGKISHLFYQMQAMIEFDNNTDFLSAWNNSTQDENLFSNDATREVLNFVENFGKKTLDIELENIKKCEKVLEQLIESEDERYIKEKKLIYTFGAAIGAVIVILGI